MALDMRTVSIPEIEQWICDRGLNNEMLHEYPAHLHKYCRPDGERIWQYPCQFAPYLAFLRDYFKDSPEGVRYLEIGCRWGGTLRATVDFLRECGIYCRGEGLDPEAECLDSDEIGINAVASTSAGGRFVAQSLGPWDLVLIDGDHSREGILHDWNLVKDRARLVAFHDIASDVCADSKAVFYELARKADPPPDRGNRWVFDDQHPEVNGSYMGIGVIERRKEGW